MTSERRECGVVKPPITPEMIEEGIDELYGFRITDPDHEEMRDAVRAVFVRVAYPVSSGRSPSGRRRDRA